MTDLPITILDGGLSTALEGLGHASEGPLWTGELLLNQPELVTAAHREFVDAGAEILITGSYQLSRHGGTLAGWSEDEVETAIRNSTTAARLASDEGTLVAASIGPFGATLSGGAEFTGDYDTEWRVVRDFHANRLDSVLATEPDLLAIETMPDLTEIDIILTLVAERTPDLPLWVSCTIGDIGFTRARQSFSDVASRVEAHASAIAVGINCSAPHLISPTLAETDTELPFIVYPNLGQTWDGAGQRWIGDPKTASVAELADWVGFGARIIGGCCGYGSREIRALAQHLAEGNVGE
jgi:homocysteine S-methyltransferase